MKIVRILIGALIILISILQIKNDLISSILGILLGIILIPNIWGIFQKKYNIVLEKKYKILIALLIILLLSLTLTKKENPPTKTSYDSEVKEQNSKETKKYTEDEKKKAQSDLEEVFSLAEKAKLVSNYEFSDTKRVVYVNSDWYTQTAIFKKDFMGKVASLLEIITGYHRFEVRDTYSDEKVAEVTAFSGSIEVYK